MEKENKIREIYREVHACKLCHRNENGTVKPDSEKVVRKFFPKIIIFRYFSKYEILFESILNHYTHRFYKNLRF